MVRLISAMGRISLVLAAVLTFAVAAYMNYPWAVSLTGRPAFGQGPVQPVPLLISLLVALIITGTFFGVIATLYDIRDSLRTLARIAQEDAAHVPQHVGPNRREPKFQR